MFFLFFQPFCPSLIKVSKKCQYAQTFFFAIWVDADFESVKKISKNLVRKKLFFVFQPFCPRLIKVCKKCQYDQTFFSFKSEIWASKNAEFGADLESVEKVAKNLVRKKLSKKK
jgi:hypothetical protein